MTYQTLLIDISDGIATVTINRPEKLNALNREVIEEIRTFAQSLHEPNPIRGVIITGAGSKAFVAGADIAELADLDPAAASQVALRGQEGFDFLEQSGIPVIAAVNGFALGGGCELAMACHIRIAAESARFGQPEVKLGLCPGYGGTVRLAKLVGRGRAVELLLTGEMIDAAEAYRIGLVNRVVPASELLATCQTVMKKILANGPRAVAACLQSVHNALDFPSDQAQDLEAELFGKLFGTADMREGTTAFLERRTPNFTGE